MYRTTSLFSPLHKKRTYHLISSNIYNIYVKATYKLYLLNSSDVYCVYFTTLSIILFSQLFGKISMSLLKLIIQNVIVNINVINKIHQVNSFILFWYIV